MIRLAVVVLALLLPVGIARADQTLAQGDSIQVKVRSTAIRTEAKAWASPVAIASYGDSLTVVALGGGWVKIKTAAGKQGYVHSSAVTARKVILSSKGPSDYKADSSEIVMAGKGFNKKVEQQYAAANAGANFREVDAMEKLKARPADVAAFVRDGKLGLSGGKA